ncbi:hypothetical protein CERSUDRAFT_100185 [Gelatoporia subvermispora B]|uniref:phospholipase D n=1 Tax=Ceriporiopsis subvermispora (strain B) TaxID=914234 RepID=M2QI01_CERS8|nr:hypothetical protein CERSUDRAFT_100185 [Gelatoporia subvermispora B]
MIVDEQRVIMGSANINDRSQKGDGDSEIALVIEDDDIIDSQMDVAGPLADATLDLWNSIAKRNRDVFTEIFRPVPTNLVRTWEQYDNYVPKAITGHVVPEVPLARVKDRLPGVRGALVDCPIDFLIDQKDFVNDWFTRPQSPAVAALHGLFSGRPRSPSTATISSTYLSGGGASTAHGTCTSTDEGASIMGVLDSVSPPSPVPASMLVERKILERRERERVMQGLNDDNASTIRSSIGLGLGIGPPAVPSAHSPASPPFRALLSVPRHPYAEAASISTQPSSSTLTPSSKANTSGVSRSSSVQSNTSPQQGLIGGLQLLETSL